MIADDEVYMAEEESRQEYVLEDTGLIWRGSHNRLRPTPWAYSQFERDCLECALYLLSGPGRLSESARADPVKTARAVSAAVSNWGKRAKNALRLRKINFWLF